jgi:hypothetical protein
MTEARGMTVVHAMTVLVRIADRVQNAVTDPLPSLVQRSHVHSSVVEAVVG